MIFGEALDSGEIPDPPQTPARIAQARAKLSKLIRALKTAQTQLSQCLSQNP